MLDIIKSYIKHLISFIELQTNRDSLQLSIIDHSEGIDAWKQLPVLLILASDIPH